MPLRTEAVGPLEDIPFDDRRGVIRNEGGRVIDDHGVPLRGEYVVGWIKRGASGVIGTNKKDAAETTAKIVQDAEAGALNAVADSDPDELAAFHAERAPDTVTWTGWQAIDEAEQAAGEPQGRPRVKLVRLNEMVEAARTVDAVC
jgi:ferredoxin/flavodoxin---NADP+ reductase